MEPFPFSFSFTSVTPLLTMGTSSLHVWKITAACNVAATREDGGDEVGICSNAAHGSTPPHCVVNAMKIVVQGVF